MPNTNNTLKTIGAFASIYVFWGLTFLAVSYALRGFPPFLLAGLRFLVAGTLLFTWRYLSGERHLNRAGWGKNAVTGILILSGGTGLVAWGEQYVSATEAAIAIATGPFWFILIDRSNWSKYFSNKLIIAGLMTGFGGLLFFRHGSIPAGSGRNNMRIAAFLVMGLSSVSWVLGSLYSRKRAAAHSTFMNIAQQLLAAGITSLLAGTLRGEWHGFVWSAIPASAWAGLGFLVLFGSVITYLSYIWLLSVKDPVSVSTHTYINPVVAVLGSWVIAGQAVNSAQIAGLGIILTGVLLTNSAKYKPGRRSQVKLRRMRQFVLPPYHFKTSQS